MIYKPIPFFTNPIQSSPLDILQYSFSSVCVNSELMRLCLRSASENQALMMNIGVDNLILIERK